MSGCSSRFQSSAASSPSKLTSCSPRLVRAAASSTLPSSAHALFAVSVARTALSARDSIGFASSALRKCSNASTGRPILSQSSPAATSASARSSRFGARSARWT